MREQNRLILRMIYLEVMLAVIAIVFFVVCLFVYIHRLEQVDDVDMIYAAEGWVWRCADAEILPITGQDL